MPPERINRTLVQEDRDGNRMVIDQDEISDLDQPVVILGDPGMGKSVLAEMLGELPDTRYFPAGTFVRTAVPDLSIADGVRVVIDGLDELAYSAVGGGVESVLEKLSQIGRPPFVISCREVDWRGATDRIKIEDDYAAKPVLLHLQPFTRENAHFFLSNEFVGIDPDIVLDHLSSRGLEHVYGNPLTLRLFGEVAQQEESLPETRADILERASLAMVKERNPRHTDAPHARRSPEELLLAAGAICATQLLCDRTGVYSGPYGDTPENHVNLSDIVTLPSGGEAGDALRTRMFQATGEHRFTHIHRVVAEYLGAKYLVHCFESGLSKRRIFALFDHGNGVPTSLRGLHAWMAHFSDVLAEQCIATDPYAVLRYGDAEGLAVQEARALLRALRQLSDEDPYFRSDSWERYPASGLMRAELKDEILAVIQASEHHAQLSILLIEAMIGTELAEELLPSLNEIVFDRNRNYAERSFASDAILGADSMVDVEAFICRLLAMGDENSPRLACSILISVGARTVSIETCIETVLTRLGLSEIHAVETDGFTSLRIAYGLFRDLDADKCEVLLDGLIARTVALADTVDRSVKAELADLIRRLVHRVLEANPMIDAQRVWSWIGQLDGASGYDTNARKELATLLQTSTALREALLEHVLLAPTGESTWMAGHRLYKTGLDLYPTNADIVGLLSTLRNRAGDGAMDPDTWRELLLLVRSEDGITDIVRDAAGAAAGANPALLSMLEEISNPEPPEWKIEHEQQEIEYEAERQEIFQSHRDHIARLTPEVEAGDFRYLEISADVYLGRVTQFVSSASPEERVREFLGDTLGERVLTGFINVLHRDDLPSAAEIAETHSDNQQWYVERPMICGVAEMIRRGRPLDRIDRPTLAAAYMSWWRDPDSGTSDGIDIGPALEQALFTSDEEIEAHFRASIEPQLERRREHVDELYRLAHETRYADLAGRLAADWLGRFPSLPKPVQHDLMCCALLYGEHDALNALVCASRERVHTDYETMRLWLLADYAVEFDRCHRDLERAAADDPDFLWLFRDLMSPERRPEFYHQFSIAQLAFVVEAFASQWPRTEYPSGVMTGIHNPWHASDFLERAIFEISNRKTPEATNALQKMAADGVKNYTDTARHALALQRRARRDFEYAAPTIPHFRAAMTEGLPETVGDMRAYVGDRIEALQKRLRASNTDMWETYWEKERPAWENRCRNRLIEQVSGQLPESIRFEPEGLMPGGRRADIVAVRNSIGLPLEIKGQWNRNVWDAASEQLDARYSCDWRAEGQGVYVVLWFGDVRGKRLPKHPDGRQRPDTPEALRQMLIDRMPEERRSRIDVYVIDVSEPGNRN